MKNRRILWGSIIAVIAGCLLVIASFMLDNAVHTWQHIHRWRNILLLSRYVTRLTDWPVHVIVGLSLAGVTWWRGNKKWSRIFLAMILAGALAGTAAYALKLSTGRVRPSVKVEKVWGGPDVRQNFQSFPSGHTAFTSGFFALLFFVSWRLGLLFLPVPLFIGFTRIFLGAHYFSDVICAMILGALSAWIVATLVLRRIQID